MDSHNSASILSGGRSSPVSLPDAIIAHDLATMARNPDYGAAKAGDREAALRIVRELLTPEIIQLVQQVIGDRSPRIVPVLAIEASGFNMLPAMAAQVLAFRLGWIAERRIIQSNKAQRSSMSGLDRVFTMADFDGPVIEGADYLIVDDTLTQGGTFASLADFIAFQGGTVVGALALTGKQYSAKLSLSDETLGQLRDRFGDLEHAFRQATGHGFDRLTESEARALVKFKPIDRVRSLILERANGRGHGLG